MLVGVDIGTSKVVAIVAEARGEHLEIIGLGTHSSKGLKNGVVVDIESTTTAIKKSIDEAESMAGCHIGSCYVGISRYSYITRAYMTSSHALSFIDRFFDSSSC